MFELNSIRYADYFSRIIHDIGVNYFLFYRPEDKKNSESKGTSSKDKDTSSKDKESTKKEQRTKKKGHQHENASKKGQQPKQKLEQQQTKINIRNSTDSFLQADRCHVAVTGGI